MPTFNLTQISDVTQQNPVIVQPMTPNSCKNCGTILTCGCQRLIASDGTEVCDDCVTKYEEGLNS